MRMALPAPKSRTFPYMPDKTYATASPIVINTPSNFCAPFLPTIHHQSQSELCTIPANNPSPVLIRTMVYPWTCLIEGSSCRPNKECPTYLPSTICLCEGGELPGILEKTMRWVERYLQKGAVLPDTVVNLNELRTSKELHDKPWCNDGSNAKLHNRASIGCKNHTHPVERIGSGGRVNTIEWQLTANQKDEKGNYSIHHFLSERDLPVCCLNLWQKW